MSEPQKTEGLLASARQMLQTLSQLLAGRVELFLLELKEERVRLVSVLLLALAAGVCALMALMLTTFIVVVLFWDGHRTPVLVALAVAYGAGAVGAWLSLRRRLRRWQSFSTTLEQIKKDRACLETRN